MRRAAAAAAVCIGSLGALLLPLGMPRPAAAQQVCGHASPAARSLRAPRARGACALRPLRGGADDADQGMVSATTSQATADAGPPGAVPALR